jgi:hypothetical protein
MNNNINNISFLLQLYSLEILLKDYNNSDLMQELQTQDEKYFKTIIKQNNEILNLLRKEDSNERKVGKEN